MILFLLTSLIIGGSDFSDTSFNANSQISVKKNDMLRASISIDKELPEEFYGTWAVKSTLIETNNPKLFNKTSTNVWVFGRKGKIVTLSNPIIGITASITVNEVTGKKAKFTREESSENYTQIETPEITIEGDSFSGEDKLIIKHLYKDKIYKTDVVKYKLEGKKMSGSALKDLFAK